MRLRSIILVAFGCFAVLTLASCGADRDREEQQRLEMEAAKSRDEAERLRVEAERAALEAERAKERKAVADIKLLDLVVFEYHLETGQKGFPVSLDELTAPNIFGKILLKAEVLRDPWGGFYRYDPSGPRNLALGEAKPDIWCERDGFYFCNWKSGKAPGAP